MKGIVRDLRCLIACLLVCFTDGVVQNEYTPYIPRNNSVDVLHTYSRLDWDWYMRYSHIFVGGVCRHKYNIHHYSTTCTHSDYIYALVVVSGLELDLCQQLDM